MSEWKRNKRRTNGFPKGIKEGMVLEVRFRNGDVQRRTVGRVEGSDLDWINDSYFNTSDGIGCDVMAYRVVSEPAAAPAITPPDHSKGFPVGTTAKDIGAKVGDEFVVVDSIGGFENGTIIKLKRDDLSECPFFADGEVEHCMFWYELAPIPPKTAIELQAEEVVIPEPVQLVDDAKPDADGWIEWKGGECPVPDGTLVEVKFGNGHTDSRNTAGAWRWEWSEESPLSYSITAYRLHQPQEWPEDRMDIVGQNGNDGLHCTSEQQAAEADKRIDDAAQGVREAFGIALPTNKYQRTIKGVTVDVYDVLAVFGVTCQARGHAIKKLLMAGQRGHKDEAQDLREAVQAIERSIELVGK